MDIGLKIGISQVYRIVSLAFSWFIADKKQLKPSINESKLAVFESLDSTILWTIS